MKYYNDKIQRKLKANSLQQINDAYAATIDRQREEIQKLKIKVNKLEQKISRK